MESRGGTGKECCWNQHVSSDGKVRRFFGWPEHESSCQCCIAKMNQGCSQANAGLGCGNSWIDEEGVMWWSRRGLVSVREGAVWVSVKSKEVVLPVISSSWRGEETRRDRQRRLVQGSRLPRVPCEQGHGVVPLNCRPSLAEQWSRELGRTVHFTQRCGVGPAAGRC